MKKYGLVLLLTVLAFVLRFLFFNSPPEVVFDEVHFGKLSQAYQTGEHYFDLHPPLGKLLIAGVARLGGITITDTFNQIGQSYDPHGLFVLRLLPALFSALFVPLIYVFTLEPTDSGVAAFFAAFFVLLDNALITHSRLILLDIFLLFFSFLALWLFLRADNTPAGRTKMLLLVGSGLALGASYAIKWTGLATVLLIAVVAFYRLAQDRAYTAFFEKTMVVLAVSALVYITAFVMHFALLDKPGPGDAFFSPEFAQKGFFGKFIALNQQMYHANKSLRAEHPFASKWYQWPLGRKGMFFWQNTSLVEADWRQQQAAARQATSEILQKPGKTDLRQEIWLFGNPAVWLFGLAGVVSATVLLLMALGTRHLAKIRLFLLFFLLLAWSINLFSFAPIIRPLFMYHYFFSLVFSLILAGVVMAHVYAFSRRKAKTLVNIGAGVVIVCSVLGYFLVAPVTYGLPFRVSGSYHAALTFFFDNGIIGILLLPQLVWRLFS